MTNWVHELGREWGHWLRKADALAGKVDGTLGRIYEEGPAAAAIRTGNRSKVLAIEFPKEVDRFHRAWLKMPNDSAELLLVEYKLRIPAREKWRLVGKKKGAYYRARSAAQIYIAGLLENKISESC